MPYWQWQGTAVVETVDSSETTFRSLVIPAKAGILLEASDFAFQPTRGPGCPPG